MGTALEEGKGGKLVVEGRGGWKKMPKRGEGW